MDAGGAEGPIPEELLQCVTVLSPNETELARLTAMPTNSLAEILKAASRIQSMVMASPILTICIKSLLLVSRNIVCFKVKDRFHNPCASCANAYLVAIVFL